MIEVDRELVRARKTINHAVTACPCECAHMHELHPRLNVRVCVRVRSYMKMLPAYLSKYTKCAQIINRIFMEITKFSYRDIYLLNGKLKLQ